MRFKRFFRWSGNWRKGQSLVELTLVLTVLLTLMTGMVEFGYLLNQYIGVIDAAREGARFGSNDDPYIRNEIVGVCEKNVDSDNNPATGDPPPFDDAFCLRENFFTNIDQIIEGTLVDDGTGTGHMIRATNAKGALSPIKLRPEIGDDVVVSVFSIHAGVLTRFPSGEDGWSYSDYETDYTVAGQKSAFSTAELEARLDATAPDTGMVLVEVIYNYDQILKFFGFLGVPDPIRVHTYSIMPLSAAEPTPLP